MASRACAISTPRAIASPPSLLALPSTCGACTAWSQPESVRGDPNHPRSAHCRAAIRALVVAVPLTDRSSCPTTTAAPSRAKVSMLRSPRASRGRLEAWAAAPMWFARRWVEESGAQTLHQIEILRMLWRQDAVADQEVDDHQGHVELELVRVAHEGGDLGDRHQAERGDLAVMVVRREALRHREVVAEQH